MVWANTQPLYITIPEAQLLGGQETSTMIKTSSRRKLAESLLSKGLSNIGKTLNTPVSKLTNKQRLAGVLGLTGIAGSLAALRPAIGEIGNELLQVAGDKGLSGLDTAALLRRNGMLEEEISNVLNYKNLLRAPLAEGTLNYINDIKDIGLKRSLPDFIPSGGEFDRYRGPMLDLSILGKSSVDALYEKALNYDMQNLPASVLSNYTNPFKHRGLTQLDTLNSFREGFNIDAALQRATRLNEEGVGKINSIKFPELLKHPVFKDLTGTAVVPQGMSSKQYLDHVNSLYGESNELLSRADDEIRHAIKTKTRLDKAMEQALNLKKELTPK